MQTAVEVEALSSRYERSPVLDQLSFQVASQEVFVIMGASGAGKSTLFRHLVGLRPPLKGTVRVLGKDLFALRKRELYELRKQFGVAFQSGGLFSSMSVGENVELPLRQHTRLDPGTMRIMSRMKLELMNLSGCEHMMPAELSGGMLKRVGLARAAIMDPRILFLDEPSAGLDPVNAAELDDLILKLREALGVTIVMVTHDLISALKVADRILIIENGAQVVTGSVREIRTSCDPRVQNLLRRKAADAEVDAEAYLRRLTAED
jgi:phospholipid/cholesterol/gamma-HCH transport system ATP-binding protein